MGACFAYFGDSSSKLSSQNPVANNGMDKGNRSSHCSSPCRTSQNSSALSTIHSSEIYLEQSMENLSLSNLQKLQHEVSRAVLNCTNEGDLRCALDVIKRCNGDCSTSFSTLSNRRCSTRARTRSLVIESSHVLSAVNSAKKSEAQGIMGLDIGGTLAKLVYMQVADDIVPLAEGVSSLQHSSLSFDVHVDADRYRLSFISGTTSVLQQALCDISALSPTANASNSKPKQIWATGGGAQKFKTAMREMIDVEMLPLKEMSSLVDGLHFLLEHGPKTELFKMNEKNVATGVPLPSPEFMYPCLLVNMGSGVSILQINDPESELEPPYVRVGGTACGGATFLGLAQIVAPGRKFPELLELALDGDATRVNKLVRDIYGEDGCAALGLPANLTAAHFGKLISAEQKRISRPREADLVAALLIMVVQESALLARAFAQLLEARIETSPPVFFVGGFLQDNSVARTTIANTFRNLGMDPPLFLQHADFLGALGAVDAALQPNNERCE